MKKLSCLALAVCLLPTSTTAQESVENSGGAFSCPEGDDSIACHQKKQVEEIWIDMNQSVSTLTDELVTNPDKAIEAGCLDDIMQLDLSVITVDPYGVWNTVYAGLKDELMNMACSAVEEKLNEATAYLDLKLEAPMGLGSVSLGQSGHAQSFSDAQDARVHMNNNEARDEVINQVFGEYPRVNQRQWTEQSIERRRIENGGPSNRARRDKKEESLRSVLNINNVFNDDEDKNAEGDND